MQEELKRLPHLKYDPIKLFELYHTNTSVRKVDIERAFQISTSKSRKVFDIVRKQMLADADDDNKPIYYENIVPLCVLFKLYGWDINQIEKSAKKILTLQKLKS